MTTGLVGNWIAKPKAVSAKAAEAAVLLMISLSQFARIDKAQQQVSSIATPKTYIALVSTQ